MIPKSPGDNYGGVLSLHFPDPIPVTTSIVSAKATYNIREPHQIVGPLFGSTVVSNHVLKFFQPPPPPIATGGYTVTEAVQQGVLSC